MPSVRAPLSVFIEILCESLLVISMSSLGNCYLARGEKYIGMWLGDQRHGYGIVVTVDGVYYEGRFVQNKLAVSGPSNCVEKHKVIEAIFRSSLCEHFSIHFLSYQPSSNPCSNADKPFVIKGWPTRPATSFFSHLRHKSSFLKSTSWV